MSTEALEEALRELHAGHEEVPASLPGEAAAMAAFDARFGEAKRKASTPRGWRGWTRVAAAVASMALVVGACSLPASYDVKLGLGLEVQFDPQQEPPFEAMARYAKEELGATDINVTVHVLDDRSGRLWMRVWGQDLPPDLVIDRLQADFPSLAPLDIEYEILEGRIDTNLGGKLWHQVFDPVIAEDDLEVARERLLVELLARGVDGEVEVEMHEVEGGGREIRVGVTKVADEDALLEGFEGIGGLEALPEGHRTIRRVELVGGAELDEELEIRTEKREASDAPR